MNILQAAMDLIAAVDAAENADGAVRALFEAGRRFGLSRMLAVGLPDPDQHGISLESFTPGIGFAEEWVQRYGEKEYYGLDPVVLAMRATRRAVRWRDAPDDAALASDQRKFWGEATEFGLFDGFAIPIFQPHGGLATISFGSERAFDGDETARRILMLVAFYAHGKISSFIAPLRAAELAGVRLAPRELECLKWTSEGLHAHEIAEKLRLSARTVEEYFGSLRKKLGCRSTPHAVATAMRLGILR